MSDPQGIEAGGERVETRVSPITCRVVSGAERDLLVETLNGAP